MSDINEIILTKFYDRITDDETMEDVFGEGNDVQVFLGQAAPDSNMPYIVHKCDFRDAGEGAFPVRKGSYSVDIWDQSDDATRVLDIRNRLVELFDRYQFDDDDVSLDGMDIQTDGFVPDPTPGVWHYVMLFNLRIYRKTEALYIINRTEEQGGGS